MGASAFWVSWVIGPAFGGLRHSTLLRERPLSAHLAR